MSRIDPNVSYASEDETEAHIIEVKKNRGVSKQWKLVKTFEGDSGAEDFLKSEKTWAKFKRQQISTGEKIYYRCNLNPKKGVQCACQIYIFKPDISFESIIYTSGEHTHLSVKRTIKNINIRLQILELASNGMKAKSIAEYLSKNNDPATVPTVRSIRNYLGRTNYALNEENKISIGQIIEWLQANSHTPDNNAEPFVLSFDCSENMAADKYFLGY